MTKKEKIKEIIEECAKANGIEVPHLVSGNRTKPIPDVKKLICALCMDYGFSTTEIGNQLNIDHSSVSIAKQKFYKELYSQELKQLFFNYVAYSKNNHNQKMVFLSKINFSEEEKKVIKEESENKTNNLLYDPEYFHNKTLLVGGYTVGDWSVMTKKEKEKYY